MSIKKTNKTAKTTAPKAEAKNIEANNDKAEATPGQQAAVPEPETPIVDELELSEHEQELNRRIDPSQPMVDPGAKEDERYSADSVDISFTPSNDDEVSTEALERLAAFTKLYPGNKVFHFTSDGQMFLDANKRDAETHENSIGGTGVQSFEVQ